jgi:hypothetical protein
MKFEVLKKEETLKQELRKSLTEDECSDHFQELRDDLKAIPEEVFAEAFMCENALNEKEVWKLEGGVNGCVVEVVEVQQGVEAAYDVERELELHKFVAEEGWTWRDFSELMWRERDIL